MMNQKDVERAIAIFSERVMHCTYKSCEGCGVDGWCARHTLIACAEAQLAGVVEDMEDDE